MCTTSVRHMHQCTLCLVCGTQGHLMCCSLLPFLQIMLAHAEKTAMAPVPSNPQQQQHQQHRQRSTTHMCVLSTNKHMETDHIAS
jgi:hypothetical protein